MIAHSRMGPAWPGSDARGADRWEIHGRRSVGLVTPTGEHKAYLLFAFHAHLGVEEVIQAHAHETPDKPLLPLLPRRRDICRRAHQAWLMHT